MAEQAAACGWGPGARGPGASRIQTPAYKSQATQRNVEVATCK